MTIKQFPYFRFFIGAQEVFPLGSWAFENVLIEEDGFFFRLELNGSLIFKNNEVEGRTDYDIVKALESNVFTALTVKRRCSGVYTTYWSGYLDLLEEWDNDAGELVTKAVPDDEHTPITEKFDKEYNLFSLGLTKRTIIDTELNPDGNYANGYYLKEIIDYILDDFDGIEYESEFLDNATNPVTGLSNVLNDMVLHREENRPRPPGSYSK